MSRSHFHRLILSRPRSGRVEGWAKSSDPMDRAFVYILRCADGSLYTGVTRRSVDERVSEHNAGPVDSYTSIRRPVELIHSESHLRIDEAIASERRIKGWSRAKKLAYIRGDFDALHRLAERRSKKERGAASFDTGPSGPAQDEDC